MGLAQGQRYGTILVDLETNEIANLLAAREAATLAQWLTDHPGVEAIARDRAGAYAFGVRERAPGAQQVADRCHVLRNCSEALLDVLERSHRAVRKIGKSMTRQYLPRPESPAGAHPGSKAVRLQIKRRQSRRAVFGRVMELSRLGWSQFAI